MGKNKNLSDWATEIEYGEIYEEYANKKEILDQAYEAMNNFCQKESKRSKVLKTKKHCWQ